MEKQMMVTKTSNSNEKGNEKSNRSNRKPYRTQHSVCFVSYHFAYVAACALVLFLCRVCPSFSLLYLCCGCLLLCGCCFLVVFCCVVLLLVIDLRASLLRF